MFVLPKKEGSTSKKEINLVVVHEKEEIEAVAAIALVNSQKRSEAKVAAGDTNR
jgi:hypothetical protein